MRRFAAALVFVLAGCGGTDASLSPGSGESTSSTGPSSVPTASPAPTIVPTPTASPPVVPSPEPNPDPCARKPYTGPSTIDPLLPRAAVRVAVAELNLRQGPCTASRKIATLEEGTVLVVAEDPYGPFKANGYAWYEVIFPPGVLASGELQPLPGSWFPDGTDTDGGWIAAHDNSRALVAPLAPRCPTAVDLENVVAMLPSEWLACFDDPIVVEGTYGCGGCGGTGGPVAEPRWLTNTLHFEQLRVRWGDMYEYQPVGIHFSPTGPAAPPEGSIIRATLHVDDPAAAWCSFRWTIEDPPFTVSPEFSVGYCRERFVVDAYEVLGIDSNYPG